VRQRGLLASTASAALVIGIGIQTLPAAPGGERSLTIYNIHTKETVTAIYKRNGRFVEAGLEKLNHITRDYRRNETTRMDPELFDLLWQVHNELGSRQPIHLVSGYRSRSTNDMLRRTVGGQAGQSRHILGKAADVHFPDVPVKQLRYSALVQERGGVGYYPTSALPFVHLDTDRVRSWPRLPRHELALLFPSGSTRHAPTDGGPITKEDVYNAKARHGELARQVALFHARRATGGSVVALADAGHMNGGYGSPARISELPRAIEPAQPTLIEQPRRIVAGLQPSPMPASLRAAMAPTAGDRARLAQLAGLATTLPSLVSGPVPARRPSRPSLPSLTGHTMPVPPGAIVPSKPEHTARRLASLGPTAFPETSLNDADRSGLESWIAAPAYDEEHPEELSYRPFPIGPYLTDTAQQPLMTELIAPDLSRTLELLDQPESGAMLRFRPSAQAASAMWTRQFTGNAIAIDRMRDLPAAPTPGDLRSRSVRTSSR